MAKRKGFLRRIVDRILSRDEPPGEPPPPPPPPKPPPKPPESPEDRHERRMREIYANVNNGEVDEYYEPWRDTFEPLEVIFETDKEKEGFWNMYLRSFKLTTHDKGHVKRETFYNRTGVPRSEIEWTLWRDIMGYAKK